MVIHIIVDVYCHLGTILYIRDDNKIACRDQHYLIGSGL